MIELTHLRKANGVLTKQIHLTDTGTIVSDGSACVMSTCDSAWKKDPLRGVIGVQTGPL